MAFIIIILRAIVIAIQQAGLQTELVEKLKDFELQDMQNKTNSNAFVIRGVVIVIRHVVIVYNDDRCNFNNQAL